MSKRFIHEPVQPLRTEVLGEFVFLTQWQALMASKPEECGERSWLDLVLRDFGKKATQRHATVAASLVTWFGSNCGRDLLGRAKRAAADCPGGWKSMGWVRAWAEENYRCMGRSDNCRTLEHLLASRDDYDHHGYLRNIPTLTADDYEVAEHVCAWMGTHEGGVFLAECEAMIERMHTAARHKMGRILPAALPGAVWNTPAMSRDSEDLCVGGHVLGGWAKTGSGGFQVTAIRLDRAPREAELPSMEAARAWVEAESSKVLQALRPS